MEVGEPLLFSKFTEKEKEIKEPQRRKRRKKCWNDIILEDEKNINLA